MGLASWCTHERKSTNVILERDNRQWNKIKKKTGCGKRDDPRGRYLKQKSDVLMLQNDESPRSLGSNHDGYYERVPTTAVLFFHSCPSFDAGNI